MGLEFLARVRRSTLWMGAVVALLTAYYATPASGLALALGAAWSLVNLALIQGLVVALTGSERGTPPGLKRAGFSIAGMGALFAAGAFLLAKLPPEWLLAGFLAPFAVLTLKAASALVLETRAWRALTASPWRATAIIALLLVAAWWAVPATMKSGRAAAQEHGARVAGEAVTPQHGAAGGHAAAGPHAAAAGPEKFANVITVLHRAFPDAPWAEQLHRYEVIIFSLFIALMLCVVAMIATRNPQMIPGPLQNGVELVVEKLYDFILDILGPRYGPRYVPFLGTLFVYILAMNLFGLIPFMDSPTSSLNVTVALALIVFLYSQYIGFRELGVLGWVDHMAGNPRGAIGWGLVPLMLPIHLMGELAKPISLACRLFGNIFGEDMLLVAFTSLGITVLSFTHLPIGLPLQLPFLFLALLTSTLQALVFTVLSTIYFLLMLPHDEHGHEGEVQHAH